MKSKHTAGPYSCHSESGGDWHIITAHGGRIIANIHIEPGNGMDEANARLLTSAPELFEALDCLIAVVGLTAFKYEGQRAALQDAVNFGYAALAKAKGDAS